MALKVIQVLLSLILELIIIRAMCKVLDMRSYPLYVGLHLGCFCLSYYLSLSATPLVMRIIIINVLTNYLLPIVISRGSLRSRLVRMTAVNLATVIFEAVGDFLYIFLHPDVHILQTSLATGDTGTICLIYCAIIPIAALTEEMVVIACRLVDDGSDGEIEIPGVLMMILSFVFYIPLIFRADQTPGRGTGVYIVAATYAFVSLVISLALIRMAKQDAQASRQTADRVAFARQDRHVRSEIEASVRRTTEMSRLRHDLANQVEVVEQLAARGRYAEADRYLEGLQAQARTLGDQQSPTLSTRTQG